MKTAAAALMIASIIPGRSGSSLLFMTVHMVRRPHGRGPSAAARVRRNVELLVAALDHTKFTMDSDHNYLTGKRLVKIVPAVVYRAHEYCKALGRRLETELKSMIVANLHRLGRL